MRPTRYGIIALFWIWLAILPQQEATPVFLALTSPRPGEALQGVVTIVGTTAVDGFAASEVSFAYSHNKLSGWFLIHESQLPVTQDAVATWDTTTITDGDYDLRLTVLLADGSLQQIFVEGVRVRNYTLIETNTPAPTATLNATQSPVPTATLTRTPVVMATAPKHSETPLPTNPAKLAGSDVLGSLAKGGLVTAGLFLVGGLYLAVKSLFRR